MKKFLAFLKHEFIEMLPPTIYFLIVFNTIGIARNFMAQEWGIKPVSLTVAALGALIVGKAVIVAEALPFAHLFSSKRVIYSVLFKSGLYGVIALSFQFLEEFIPEISKSGGVSNALQHVLENVNWPKFWYTHVFMLLFLFIYNLVTAVISGIGKDKILGVLLSPRQDNK